MAAARSPMPAPMVAELRYPRRIVFASPSSVLSVPLLPAVLGTFAVGVGLAVRGELWWFALGGLAAWVFVVLTSRRVRRQGDRITVRGVLMRDEIGIDAAFGWRGTGGRSAQLEIFASDGERLVVLWTMTARGLETASRTIAKLKASIPTTPSAAAQATVDEIQAPHDEVLAQLRAYYDK